MTSETALETAQAILTDPLWSAIAVRSEAIGCHIEARYAGKYHLAWDATAEGAARLLAEIGPREHVEQSAAKSNVWTGEHSLTTASDGEAPAPAPEVLPFTETAEDAVEIYNDSDSSITLTQDIGMPLRIEAGAEALAPAGEAGQDSAHESDGETGEASGGDQVESFGSNVAEGVDVSRSSGDKNTAGGWAGNDGESGRHDFGETAVSADDGFITDGGHFGGGADSADPLDADFTEETDLTDLPALAEPEEEAPDLGAELLDEGQGELPVIEDHAEPPPAPEPHQDRFYGLDDLDRRKTVAIGLVIRHAKSLMPWWTTDHDAALKELRNFAMGVSEGRWPDDPIRQLELQALETTVRRIAEIERARDNKVAFIEEADREAFATFVVEQDWP